MGDRPMKEGLDSLFIFRFGGRLDLEDLDDLLADELIAELEDAYAEREA